MQTLKALFIIQSANTIWLRSCRNICFQSIGHWGPALHARVQLSHTLSSLAQSPLHTYTQTTMWTMFYPEAARVSELLSCDCPWYGQDMASLGDQWGVTIKSQRTGEFNHFPVDVSQVDLASQQGCQCMVSLLRGLEATSPPSRLPRVGLGM